MILEASLGLKILKLMGLILKPGNKNPFSNRVFCVFLLICFCDACVSLNACVSRVYQIFSLSHSSSQFIDLRTFSKHIFETICKQWQASEQ